jgi:molybdopterin/thiamine biosynthesis adenylyltransferase
MRGKSTMVSTDYFERFASQAAVIGKQGQQKLKEARVHIGGLGGLGNLLALFLSTAGVGYISANDPQRLEMENLGRFVCGQEADIGRNKVIVAGRFLHRNRHLAFEPVVAGNESPLVKSLYERADWIFSCANTVRARTAAAPQAVKFSKPIIDVGVSDGRVSLTGSIKYWLPECADWSACPACYLASSSTIHPRNEGLLFTVLAASAALAAHMYVALVTGTGTTLLKSRNYLTVEMDRFQVENFAVLKRRKCLVCSMR